MSAFAVFAFEKQVIIILPLLMKRILFLLLINTFVQAALLSVFCKKTVKKYRHH